MFHRQLASRDTNGKRCSLTSSDLDRTARAVAGFLAVRGLLVQLISQLGDVLERLGASKSAWSDWLAAVDPGYRASARNIWHYRAIRQEDLREL